MERYVGVLWCVCPDIQPGIQDSSEIMGLDVQKIRCGTQHMTGMDSTYHALPVHFLLCDGFAKEILQYKCMVTLSIVGCIKECDVLLPCQMNEA